MKKFIVSLLLCLMVWTVIDKQFNDDHYCMDFILENENGVRERIETRDYRTNLLIVGDEVEIMPYSIWQGGRKILQRVK